MSLKKTEVDNTGIYVVILVLGHHSANRTLSYCDTEGHWVNSYMHLGLSRVFSVWTLGLHNVVQNYSYQ